MLESVKEDVDSTIICIPHSPDRGISIVVKGKSVREDSAKMPSVALDAAMLKRVEALKLMNS